MNNLTKTSLSTDFDLKDFKILIVDDNPTNLSVIVDYLENTGLTILVSQDGESSLKRAKYTKPGIILLDVLMPGIDGYETCIRLKNDAETQDIPVIFMTALTDIQDKVRGFEVGAVDYVSKPIQPEEVLARIKLHLKLRHLTLFQTKQNDLLMAEVEQRKAIEQKLSTTNLWLEKEIEGHMGTQKTLQKLNESLESRVKKRTNLLAQSNYKLQQEILERKGVETKLQKSLLEKEVLLKEVYHRVKNNLLVVSSLLEMQTDYIDNPEIVKMLRNSQGRIHSMALVHEQLYCSDNLKEIDINVYIKALLSNIIDSHQNQTKKINYNLDVNSIKLNIETAHSCGLIINELVTNALEHAFPGQDQGNIWVSLAKSNQSNPSNPSEITLTVKDDGVGLDQDFDFEQAESLGLSLVNILTQQLEGELKFDFQQGSRFQIKFAELDYQDRL